MYSKYDHISRGKHNSGMTLLEVVLAITIAGFVLTAATTFVVSISRIWMEREAAHFFEDHADGVSEFLQASLERSGQQIALAQSEATDSSTQAPTKESDAVVRLKSATRGRSAESTQSAGSLLQTAEQPLSWERPPGFARYREPLLKIQLSQVPPLLVNPANAPSVGIVAYLYFSPDEGLSLLWHSPLQESVEDLQDLRRTQLSPWVSEIEYIYWDGKMERWESKTQPKEGERPDQYLLPSYLKLSFDYAGEKTQRTIELPVHSQHALIF